VGRLRSNRYTTSSRIRPATWKFTDIPLRLAAYFFVWLSRHLKLPHLVPTLNFALSRRKWRSGATLREVLGGRDVDELWEEYNAYLQVKGKGTRTGAGPALPTHGARG